MNAHSDSRYGQGIYRFVREVVAIGVPFGILMCVRTPVEAGLIGGPAIIAPPESVDRATPLICSNGATNVSQEAFDESQDVSLAASLEVDPGGVSIPAGTTASSHMIFLNTATGSASGTDVWCFDGPVIGVMSDQDGMFEAASNSALGWPGTCYPGAFTYRGLEPSLGDAYLLRGNTIEVTMNTTAPGDWMRVTTTSKRSSGVTFSIDRQGPTRGASDVFYGRPIDEGDILTVSDPLFRMPNPAVPAAPMPGILVNWRGLGIQRTTAGYSELDAFSYGKDRGHLFRFSVDEWALGCDPATCPLPSDVYNGGACSCLFPSCSPGTACEASADVFAHLVDTDGNAALYDGVGGAALACLGLVEPNPPGVGIPDDGDNVDAFDFLTRSDDLLGRIYFSLEGGLTDAAEQIEGSDTAGANGFSGADVLVVDPCQPAQPGIYARASLLSLDPFNDDLDALALWDDGDGEFEPSVDEMYYSVRRGSAIIGSTDCAKGLPITEGDILTTSVQGCGCLPSICNPAIVVSAHELGLSTGSSKDELDALDLTGYPDFDGDGKVDETDYLAFVDCFAGPGESSAPTPPTTSQDCYNVFDGDLDEAISLTDFSWLQQAFSER